MVISPFETLICKDKKSWNWRLVGKGEVHSSKLWEEYVKIDLAWFELIQEYEEDLQKWWPRLKAKSPTTACQYNDIKMDIVVVIVVFPLSLSSLSDTDFSIYIFPFCTSLQINSYILIVLK